MNWTEEQDQREQAAEPSREQVGRTCRGSWPGLSGGPRSLQVFFPWIGSREDAGWTSSQVDALRQCFGISPPGWWALKCAHVHAYLCTHAPMHASTCPPPLYPRVHPCAQVSMCPRAQLPTRPHAHSPTYPCAHTPTHPRTHVPMRPHVHTHARGGEKAPVGCSGSPGLGEVAPGQGALE